MKVSAATSIPSCQGGPHAHMGFQASGCRRRRSPGWQSSTSQMASNVVNRTALARPFFRTARFAG